MCVSLVRCWPKIWRVPPRAPVRRSLTEQSASEQRAGMLLSAASARCCSPSARCCVRMSYVRVLYPAPSVNLRGLGSRRAGCMQAGVFALRVNGRLQSWFGGHNAVFATALRNTRPGHHTPRGGSRETRAGPMGRATRLGPRQRVKLPHGGAHGCLPQSSPAAAGLLGS